MYQSTPNRRRIVIKKGNPLYRDGSQGSMPHTERTSLESNMHHHRKSFITSNEPSLQPHRYINNRYGYASQAATPSRGTNVGFQDRKSDRLLYSHVSRNIKLGMERKWVY
jgi:hypothetical protein